MNLYIKYSEEELSDFFEGSNLIDSAKEAEEYLLYFNYKKTRNNFTLYLRGNIYEKTCCIWSEYLDNLIICQNIQNVEKIVVNSLKQKKLEIYFISTEKKMDCLTITFEKYPQIINKE